MRVCVLGVGLQQNDVFISSLLPFLTLLALPPQSVTKYKLGYDPVEVHPEDMVRLARETPQVRWRGRGRAEETMVEALR